MMVLLISGNRPLGWRTVPSTGPDALKRTERRCDEVSRQMLEQVSRDLPCQPDSGFRLRLDLVEDRLRDCNARRAVTIGIRRNVLWLALLWLLPRAQR